jgi:hypothetical protein
MSEQTVSNEVCFVNIGPKERQKRMTIGIISIVIGVAIAAAMILLGADRWWRLTLFLLFYAGASGIFQARDKT